ncbi:endo alpha-1,4 polygalactosaminidase [Kribbella lupini]|uniref:Endo alpha-1,4 polygalactosaminidase n=1 Tax=Kribbella lupini TaxID=291602 RepID=A0ABN2BK21_9ACTN
MLTGCADGAETPVATSQQQRWAPEQGVAWQWQLSGELDLSVDVPVYDVDYEKTSAAQVAELHQKGRRVICYVSVGSYENFRPDQAKFPAAVLGKALDGWPDERWLDIRQWGRLKPLLAARFDQCRDRGFDAVEPDNVDGYANDTGFPLTADDQLTFNRRIAALAHERGLSVGLKNDLDQIEQLQPDFDFAVNEECMRYDECDLLRPFVAAGKAVLHVEYELAPDSFCAKARALRFSSMRKPVELGAARQSC